MLALVFRPKHLPDNVFGDGEDTFRRPDRYLFTRAFFKDALGFLAIVAGTYLLMRIPE